MIRSRRVFATLGVLFATASGTLLAPHPTPAAEGAADYYYALDHQVPVRVPGDEVGLVFRDNVAEGAIRSFAAAEGLTEVRRLRPLFRIYRSTPLRSRAKQAAYARDLAVRGSSLVRHGGLIAQPDGERATALLVGRQLVIRLAEGAPVERLDTLLRKHGAERARAEEIIPHWYVFRLTSAATLDALVLANRLQESGGPVRYAHPDFIRVLEPLAPPVPMDKYFTKQWHHRQECGMPRAGACATSGTPDADIDTPEAWAISRGDPATVIAVLDFGFDLDHPEFAGVGGVAKLVQNWDFRNGDPDPEPQPIDYPGHGTAVAGLAAARWAPPLLPFRGDAVEGVCPDCRLMLLGLPEFQDDGTETRVVDAIRHAIARGAHVLSNSWELITPSGLIFDTINTVPESGPVIVIGMPNEQSHGCLAANACEAFPTTNVRCSQAKRVITDTCDEARDMFAQRGAIAVGRSTEHDCFDESWYGNCLDLLAPSADITTGGRGRGQRWLTTTDLRGKDGYNEVPPPANALNVDCPGEADDDAYTFCFGGTSAATPLVAGVAGLVRSVRPGLGRFAVQYLLQDTADKIEPSLAQYSPASGFSQPGQRQSSHGWGRINAFEAVRVVAPVALGGRGGVDVFLRDNALDWGNTEAPSNMLFEPDNDARVAPRTRTLPHWESMDIKVDAPPYCAAGACPTTAATFEAFYDERPLARLTSDAPSPNHVYVRVRNRGPVTVDLARIKAYWTQVGTTMPELPKNFWEVFPEDSTMPSDWKPLPCAGTTRTVCEIAGLKYSGATAAGSAGGMPVGAAPLADAAQVVRFDFDVPHIDLLKPNHFCLLAVVDSEQDRPLAFVDAPQAPDQVTKMTVAVDDITPYDNNVTHRNYLHLRIAPLARPAVWAIEPFEFQVRNPYPRPIKTRLRIDAPDKWQVVIKPVLSSGAMRGRPRVPTPASLEAPFELGPGGRVTVSIAAEGPPGAMGIVRIVQERTDLRARPVIGGLTLSLEPDVEIRR